MDVTASVEAPCTPQELLPFIDDLATYPRWIDLVHRAEPLPSDAAEPAWDVELRARVGRFARSKRLRMVRTECAVSRVVFERHETDGRRHAPWVLTAAVQPAADGSRLDVHLHYGGALWTGGVLERILADQITSGRERLLALVTPTH
jgi:Polyketide cyclase / dehydrase and lipid transport